MAVAINLQGKLLLIREASFYQKRNCEFIVCQCSESV